MIIWIIQDGEPLPGIDKGTRDWRCSMLAKALVARGHEVVWWASTFDHAQKRHRFSQAHTVELQPGLRIRLLHGPGYRTNKSPQRWLHHRVLARQFVKEASAAVQPDLIFASLPTIEFAEQAANLGEKSGIPVLVDVRDLWPDHYLTLVPPTLRSLARIMLFAEFRRVRRALGRATGITAITESFLNWGLSYANRDRQETDGVFAMGYPAPQFSKAEIETCQRDLLTEYGLLSDRLTIVFSGSLNSIFNFDTVLQAARILDHAAEKVQFVIAGNGPNLSPLRTEAAGLDNVIFTGWLDHLQVSAVFGFADMGLAPYVAGGSTNGSLPNKTFEYMSFGLPLLSSLRGELEELVRNEQIGLQYRAGDVSSLVERIRWLAANPAERIAMGQRAHKLFEERFSADITYSRLVAHLEQVAEIKRNREI